MVIEARELYNSLSDELKRKGVASNRFSELERLYHLASDNEKLQPEWRRLNDRTIKNLSEKLKETIEDNIQADITIEKYWNQLQKLKNVTVEVMMYCPQNVRDVLSATLSEIRQQDAGKSNPVD